MRQGNRKGKIDYNQVNEANNRLQLHQLEDRLDGFDFISAKMSLHGRNPGVERTRSFGEKAGQLARLQEIKTQQAIASLVSNYETRDFKDLQALLEWNLQLVMVLGKL